MLCNRFNAEHNGYFTFQTIIDIAGVRGAISEAVCVGLPVIIVKVNKQVHTKFGIFN